ncbi:MAG: SpoIIE family protein phosphatase [Victivallales bacterium]|nr:SpoIIE family protein phosphatase [Victivallales bacterium]
MDFLIPFIFLACVVLAVSFILWSLGSIQAFQERTRKIEAKQVTARNTLNQFMSKLATVDETFEAMDILVSSFWEDINCESIGIFVLEESTEPETVLRGAACTAMFPIFDTRDGKTHSSTIDNTALEEKVFENPRYRTAHFKSETVVSGKGLLGEVIQTRKPMIIDTRDGQANADIQPRRVWTMMAIPLTFEGKFIGLMVAVNRRDGIRAFNDHDMEEFQQLAIQAEFSANLILVYKERQKQDRIVQELASYAKMQRTLMPKIPKKVGDYRFAAYQAPAMEVSGDFYDYAVLDDHRVLLIVADATGKNLPACLMTSMCSSFVRCLKERFTDVQSFLLDLNRLIQANSNDNQFVTLAALLIDMSINECVLGNAGHTAALIRKADGELLVKKPQGDALGMWPNDDDTVYETIRFPFERGMKICLYSDGINEAKNGADELFGDERLRKLFKECDLPPRKTINMILDKVKEFSGDTPQSDDQTVMVISRSLSADEE